MTFFRNDINNYIFRQPTGEVEEEFPVVENVAADSVLMGVEAHADVRADGRADGRGHLRLGAGRIEGRRASPCRAFLRTACWPGCATSATRFRLAEACRRCRSRRGSSARSCRPTATSTAKFFASYSFSRGGVLNTITARLDNATDELYRNHLNYLKDVLPEIGRSFKLVYTMGF